MQRPAAERAAFLAAARGSDAALRGEVESLLAHSDAQSDGFAERALAKAAQLVSHAGLQPMIGRRFRVYEVLAPLGAGGMGEVYRARDSRLGRDVAIKIVPPAFKADAGRVARFECEAQVLASLKHPHIGAIYGIEDADAVTALGSFSDGRLKRIPATGGAAIDIARAPNLPAGASWASDNRIYFAHGAFGELNSVDAQGGTVERVSGLESALHPEVFPDGETLLVESGGWVHALDLRTGRAMRIVQYVLGVLDHGSSRQPVTARGWWRKYLGRSAGPATASGWSTTGSLAERFRCM